MYTNVSNAWIEAHKGYLAPEGFIEITFHIHTRNETWVFTKSDIMSFTHVKRACMMSSELPVNYIEFSLDNSDGKWNPSYPKGLARYLSERLKITLRYGFDINGVVEWYSAGTFYLSEWYTPSNGIEASFKARDQLEFMIDTPCEDELSGTMYDAVVNLIRADYPKPYQYIYGVDNRLKNYTISHTGNETVAEVIQKCANAAQCAMYVNHMGALMVDYLEYTNCGFTITSDLSYSYPEIEYLRPLKQVAVTYAGNQKVTANYSASGETQTLDNDFITTEAQAKEVALWVGDALKTRMKISGEFRGDTRLEPCDVVNVESKYGLINDVVLTEIKYTFNGAFRASYTGYVRGGGSVVEMFSGEVFSGEVI